MKKKYALLVIILNFCFWGFPRTMIQVKGGGAFLTLVPDSMIQGYATSFADFGHITLEAMHEFDSEEKVSVLLGGGVGVTPALLSLYSICGIDMELFSSEDCVFKLMCTGEAGIGCLIVDMYSPFLAENVSFVISGKKQRSLYFGAGITADQILRWFNYPAFDFEGNVFVGIRF